MKIKAILPYFGGKRKIASQTLSCLHFNPLIEKGRSVCYLESG